MRHISHLVRFFSRQQWMHECRSVYHWHRPAWRKCPLPVAVGEAATEPEFTSRTSMNGAASWSTSKKWQWPFIPSKRSTSFTPPGQWPQIPTPLWPKNSPNHHGNGSRGGWPADHKTSKTVREGQKGPPPPPPPTSCPPAVPQKSKNPPQPPPLPAQSSKDFLQRKLRGQPNSNYLNSDGTEVKGPAPQPPVGGQHHQHSGHNQQMSGGGHPVTSQPLRYNIKSFRLI